MGASPLAAAFLDSCARRLSCCRAEWNERKQETRGAAQVMSRRFGSSRHDLQASLLVSICRAARDFAERARSPLIEGILEVTSDPRRPNQCDSHVYYTVLDSYVHVYAYVNVNREANEQKSAANSKVREPSGV